VGRRSIRSGCTGAAAVLAPGPRGGGRGKPLEAEQLGDVVANETLSARIAEAECNCDVIVLKSARCD